MGIGYLPPIFPFRPLRYEFGLKSLGFFICLIAFIFFGRSCFAYEWYTVLGSGVLSTKSIKDDDMPSYSLPAGFIQAIIQKPTLGEASSFGSVISSYDVSSNASGDALVKNAKISLTDYSFSSLVKDSDILEFDTSGQNCKNMLLNGLLTTDKIYKLTGTNALSCFYDAINSASPNYDLNGDGLAVLFVKVGSSNLFMDKNLTPLSSRKRLLVVADSGVNIASSVGGDLLSVNFDSAPQIKIGLVSLNNSGISFKLEENVNKALVFEGLIFGAGDLSLSRSFTTSTYPGGFYRFDPFYLAEMSKKGLNGLVINGFVDSKITWSYK